MILTTILLKDDTDHDSDAVSDHKVEYVATTVRDSAGGMDPDTGSAAQNDEVRRDSDSNTVIYDYCSDTEDSDSDNTRDPAGWQCDDAGYQVPNDVVFTESHGIINTSGLSADSKPCEIFMSLVTPQIIELITDDTNRYTEQFLEINRHTLKWHGKFQNWTKTDPTEMRKFIGILLKMGLVRKPSIEDY